MSSPNPADGQIVWKVVRGDDVFFLCLEDGVLGIGHTDERVAKTTTTPLQPYEVARLCGVAYGYFSSGATRDES